MRNYFFYIFTTIHEGFLLPLIFYLKVCFIFLLRKPYGFFFSVVYGCLLVKYYLNVKIHQLHEERLQIKSLKEKINILEIKYNRSIYKFLITEKKDN